MGADTVVGKRALEVRRPSAGLPGLEHGGLCWCLVKNPTPSATLDAAIHLCN